jgi:putative sigma-54 modulation protein
MRLSLTGRHVDVTPGLRQLVQRRLARLERLLNDSALSTQVVLTREKRDVRAEVTVHARGDNMLSAIAAGATWTEAVGDAVEKVVQQAAKVKDRWRTRKRQGVVARRTESAPLPAEAGAPADGGNGAAAPRRRPAGEARRVPRAAAAPIRPGVRTVRYPIKPMGIEEAAARLGQVDESFVVFRQAGSERLAILFERPDGGLGLIDPES